MTMKRSAGGNRVVYSAVEVPESVMDGVENAARDALERGFMIAVVLHVLSWECEEVVSSFQVEIRTREEAERICGLTGDKCPYVDPRNFLPQEVAA